MKIDFVFDSFSLYIKNIEIQIKKNAIIFWMNGYIFGVMIINKGIIRNRDAIAIVDPRSVSFTA